MSIKFVARKCCIPKSRAFGKWYAQMVSTDTVSTWQIAEELSHSSSVTYADIIAVLLSLAVSIRQHLLNSHTVHLDGLGSLRVAIKSNVAEKPEDVNAGLVHAYHVLFMPDCSFTPTGPGPNGGRKGYYTRKLTEGITFERLQEN